MACDDHDVPVLLCENGENSLLVEYESIDLCGVRTISKLLSKPSDPLDNLGGNGQRSTLGLPELTNDMSVESGIGRSAYDFLVVPRPPLVNGDLSQEDT